MTTWGLILAGGAGPRLLGEETRLARTRHRTALVIASERTLVLVTRRRREFYASFLKDAPPGCVVRQAEDRGTAPAILYGLLRVAVAAPMDAVAVFPADHDVSDDAAFMAHVAVAFEVVRARPELIVLLGIAAGGGEPACGWIEPGEAVPAAPGTGLFRVRRLWEESPRTLAATLPPSHALGNSLVVVARIPALLGLMKQAVPALFQVFDGARPAINSESEPRTFSTLYAGIASTDFSDRVLASRPANLAVLRVSGVAWNHLGNPARVMATANRAGIEVP
jgi:mannose-1-phosphate guanylyltransferase